MTAADQPTPRGRCSSVHPTGRQCRLDAGHPDAVDHAWFDVRWHATSECPDATSPAPAGGDAVERAHRAWNEYPDYDADTDERDAWSHERDRIAAALTAARAGEAVDRESLARRLARDLAWTGSWETYLPTADWIIQHQALAARGDAAPTVNDREELDACHAADEAHGLNAGAAEAWRHTYLAALGIEVRS